LDLNFSLKRVLEKTNKKRKEIYLLYSRPACSFPSPLWAAKTGRVAAALSRAGGPA
jgi:predicted DNA-binding transcriptional regulator AlpA